MHDFTESHEVVEHYQPCLPTLTRHFPLHLLYVIIQLNPSPDQVVRSAVRVWSLKRCDFDGRDTTLTPPCSPRSQVSGSCFDKRLLVMTCSVN